MWFISISRFYSVVCSHLSIYNLDTLLKFLYIFVNCIENVSFGVKLKIYIPYKHSFKSLERPQANNQLVETNLRKAWRSVTVGHMIGHLIDHENDCFHQIGPFSKKFLKLNNLKKNNPCQNESDAIIEFLNKCYEKNSQNQNGKSKDPSEQSQFKNLRKESLKWSCHS